jgi:2-amino-4-hydroxy-6-hydroxymethyldihydropteridine diphosphokinase
MAGSSHCVHFLIGSNIEPVENVRRALLELCHHGIIRRVSRAWQTPAYGSKGPDFINLAVELVTPLTLEEVRKEVVAAIESKMGRQRSGDKNAPRTIDLDVILFDGELLDRELWEHAHLALTMSELLPDLVNPQTGESLSSFASRSSGVLPVLERPDVLPLLK